MLRAYFICVLTIAVFRLDAQKCPPNIGFETGNFDGWQCYTGSQVREGSYTLNPSQPVFGRHTLLANTNVPDFDIYGNFPVNCPNGSGFSIKLGNESTGAQVEQVSYTFTIPAGENNYSIIYHYAVVFQNPDHGAEEQPKFTANVYDESSGSYIGCSSFEYTASSSLPGFMQSTTEDRLFYKDWTPVTIKLSGYAGKTIRLEFTTFDCSRGGHFGYAYVDVNQNCSSPISGNVFCSKTEKLKLIAPFGFMDYRWYNNDFSKQLGDSSSLELKPLPQDNTKYALVITPYPQQGCTDTLFTTAVYSPEPLEFVLKNNLSACINQGADITAPSMTAGSGNNLTYSYFTNPELNKFVAVPKQLIASGKYYVLAENAAGCTESKDVLVHVEPLPKFTITHPPVVYRPTPVDITKTVTPFENVVYDYSYWADSLSTKELRMPKFIDETGRYFIKATSTIEPACITTKGVNVKILDPNIFVPNAFSPNGDGSNDDWRIPQLAYYPECIVEVYNRTGRVVYRSPPGYSQPWDGKLNGQNLPIATYYYVIKLNNELPNIGGSVTILR